MGHVIGGCMSVTDLPDREVTLLFLVRRLVALKSWATLHLRIPCTPTPLRWPTPASTPHHLCLQPQHSIRSCAYFLRWPPSRRVGHGRRLSWSATSLAFHPFLSACTLHHHPCFLFVPLQKWANVVLGRHRPRLVGAISPALW